MKQEELNWKKRAKINEILEGDSNTRYFHAKANGKCRKNRISSLDQDEGKIEGDKELITYVADFYNNLFGRPEVSSISLEIEDTKTIPDEAVVKLTADFSLQIN